MKNLMISLLTLSASFASAAPIDLNAFEPITHTRFHAEECLGSSVYGRITGDDVSMFRKVPIKTKGALNYIDTVTVTYRLYDARDGRLRGEGQVALIKDEGYEYPVGPVGSSVKTIEFEGFGGTVTMKNFRLADGSTITDELQCSFKSTDVKTALDVRLEKMRKQKQQQGAGR